MGQGMRNAPVGGRGGAPWGALAMATHHPRLLLLEGPHVIVCVGVCIYEAPDVGIYDKQQEWIENVAI